MRPKTSMDYFPRESKNASVADEMVRIYSDLPQKDLAIQQTGGDARQGFAPLMEQSGKTGGVTEQCRRTVAVIGIPIELRSRFIAETKPQDQSRLYPVEDNALAGEKDIQRKDGDTTTDASIPSEYLVSIFVIQFLSSVRGETKPLAGALSSSSTNAGTQRDFNAPTTEGVPTEVSIKTDSLESGSVEIMVRHPYLGSIRLELTINQHQLEIVAVVGRRAAAEAIRKSEGSLSTRLSAQGIELKNLKIQVGKTQKQNAEKPRTRRYRRLDEEVQS
jgi:hypothetical protein